jgi:antitoxin (DNA-binding transcriptional repressor) of toxin-antitoxin stability system
MEIIMPEVALKEAGKRLSELIGMAEQGEEIIITRADGAAFKIVPLPAKKPYPQFGSARGKLRIAEHFDEPLDDFEEYTP